ncbi:MAG TPA: hypothetical protein VGZ47_21690 [Gemmataceae bacterium]|jgi:hypothetical protein|nr:hypothetical protein [Gemmataceae bacterium]
MYQTLALAALTFAPAQDAPLSISNDRITFCGEFGPSRPNNRFLPGDTFYLAFDVENLKMDKYGVVNYMMGMEVTDSAGQSIYKQPPVKSDMVLPLGGNKMPARGFVNLDVATAPGTYNCRLTVTDLSNAATKSIDKSFEVTPAAFGIVRMLTTSDDKAEIPAPLMGIPGQVLYLSFSVVGFGRKTDPMSGTKQPNLITELRILDQNGKPTTEAPSALAYDKGVDEKVTELPFTFRIPLNRSGVYTVEVKATCKVTDKNYKITFPLTVMPSAK